MMIENLFVLSVLLLSGSYVIRRMYRMQQAFKKRESACGSCSSSSCATVTASDSGEISLPMR